MLAVYGVAKSRTLRVLWTLEELELVDSFLGRNFCAACVHVLAQVGARRPETRCRLPTAGLRSSR